MFGGLVDLCLALVAVQTQIYCSIKEKLLYYFDFCQYEQKGRHNYNRFISGNSKLNNLQRGQATVKIHSIELYAIHCLLRN